MELNSLPEQLTLYIFEYLVDKDICKVMGVSQKYNTLVADEDYLWKSLYVRKFGKAAESDQDESDKVNLGWKASYILMKKLEHCKRKTPKTDTESLMVTAAVEGYEDVLLHILKFSSRLKRRSGNTLGKVLVSVAQQNKVNSAKLLVEYGANVNAREEGTGRTPVFYAQQREMVYLFLQKGAKVDVYDNEGMGVMHYYADAGMLDAIKCLTDAETVNVKSQRGYTPLHHAAAKGHINVVKFLFNVGASANIVNDEGRSPLHTAALKGHLPVVQYLLDKHAKFDVQDKLGNTPLDLCVSAGHYDSAVALLTKDGKIINEKDVTFGTNSCKLGGGGFGEVFLIDWKNKPAALKKVKYDKLTEAGKTPDWILQKFILEVALMSKLTSNKSFLPFYGAVIAPPNLHLVLAYMAGGSLYQILTTSEGDSILTKMPAINTLASSIAQGMAYLHGLTPQIIHRDLTSQNVLIDDMGNAKIADFGISRFKMEVGDKTMTSIGNPRWRAPEVTRGQRYSEKVDVFGFGMILYEMFTRAPPFPFTEAIQVAFMVAKGQRPEIPPNCPGPWAHLIRQCWDDTPSNRPSFPQIITIISQLPVHFISSTRGKKAPTNPGEKTPYY